MRSAKREAIFYIDQEAGHPIGCPASFYISETEQKQEAGKKKVSFPQTREREVNNMDTLPILRSTRFRQLCMTPYLLFFYTASICGWLFEFPLGELFLSYRGVLHGPWAPIYGVGAVLMVILYRKTGKSPGRYFLSCIGICAIVEYFTGWILETAFHAKWWDYTGYFLNLHGRICAMSLLVFAVADMSVVYFIAPWFWSFLRKIPVHGKRVLCIGMTVALLLDFAFSLAVPNMGLGVQICGG